MFIRTQSNMLLNADKIVWVDIIPCKMYRDDASLMAHAENKDYCLFYGSKEDVAEGMNNLVEALARGATLITYYPEDSSCRGVHMQLV